MKYISKSYKLKKLQIVFNNVIVLPNRFHRFRIASAGSGGSGFARQSCHLVHYFYNIYFRKIWINVKLKFVCFVVKGRQLIGKDTG